MSQPNGPHASPPAGGHRSRRRTSRLAALMVAAVALPLAACGGSGGGTEDSDTITVWQYYGDESMPTGKPFFDVVAAYEKSSGKTVDIRYIPFSDFNRTLTQSAASGEGPDVALINAFDTSAMAGAGVIADISDRVEKWGQQDAYFPTSWETTQVKGATFGIPHLADAYAVYYNKVLLQEAGVTPPTTWAEMQSAATAIAATGKKSLAVSGIEGAEGATGLIIRLLAAGGDPTKIDSAPGRAALTSFQDLVKAKGLSEGFLTWNEDDAMTQFATEEAAMMINSATYVNQLRTDYPDLSWDVALLPKDQTGQTFLSAENLTIGGTAENPDGAWDLITYLQKPDVLADYLPARNKLPARDDVPGTDDDPVRAVFAEQLTQAWAPDADLAPVATEVFTALQAALQATVSGSSSVAEAATVAQQTIDEAMASK